ncbi:uncharacterized protein METZ01_LOCUS301795, partial [marine metagenome]
MTSGRWVVWVWLVALVGVSACDKINSGDYVAPTIGE